MMPKSTATMLAVGVDEQIARMHVGVEEAVAQRVAQEGLDHRAAELLAGRSPLASSLARSVSGVPSIHSSVSTSARGAVPVDRRHAEIRIVLGVLAPSRRARRLRAAGPSRSRPSGASVSTTSISRSRRASAERRSALRAAKLKASRSTLKRRSMPGRSTFTATAAAVRPSRLRRGAPARSRRRRPRGPNAANDVAQRLAERGCDRGFGLGLRERRHLVLQHFQVARERDADHVGARREELAELDIGRPEPRQRGRRAGRRRRAGRPLDQPRELRPQPRAASGSGAGSTRPSTPSRANTKPRAGETGRDADRSRSDHKPPAGMQRHDAAGHAADARRGGSRRRASCRRTRRARERRIEFDQIAIGLGVAGHRAAERRDRR